MSVRLSRVIRYCVGAQSTAAVVSAEPAELMRAPIEQRGGGAAPTRQDVARRPTPDDIDFVPSSGVTPRARSQHPTSSALLSRLRTPPTETTP
ncbi:unnamed protein product [Pieris brassicae]|uniref:Uncharacterized protein n=1 Tax=Pieris brassicae TaxID=7116 RepID=A0A9P0TTI3_PIEBR|nr:unnamed protein product [Pieris brassicae]